MNLEFIYGVKFPAGNHKRLSLSLYFSWKLGIRGKLKYFYQSTNTYTMYKYFIVQVNNEFTQKRNLLFKPMLIAVSSSRAATTKEIK